MTLLFFWKTKENPVKYLRIRRISLKTALICVLCSFTLPLTMNLLFTNTRFDDGNEEMIKISLYLTLHALIIAPILEEVFFRGILFREYRQGRFWKAACISSLAWAGVHSFLWRAPLIFLFGILLTVLYEYAESILAPMITHLLVNASACFGGFLALPWLAKTPIMNIAPLRYTTLALTVAGSVGLIVYMRGRTVFQEMPPRIDSSSQSV